MLTKEEIMDLAKRHRAGLKIQNEIGFGDRPFKAPGIDFYPDYVQYFDSEQYLIHIGCFGIAELFDTEDEEAFLNALNYIRGHEEQHCRSTASKPYSFGIRRGIEIVLEYISEREESSKRRFRKDADYEDFANRILPGMGIYISYKMMSELIGGIANSVEDGRIERIRSDKFAGYEKLRLVHRAIFWKKHGGEYPPYAEIENSAAEKLHLLTKEILLLATCQLHSPGFAAAYAETPLWKEIGALKPHIAKGVMSGNTRDMANEVIEICKKLAPYIYEACKISTSDMAAKEALEKMLADLIKAAVDQMAEGHQLSEENEETDEGGASSTFPQSDLVITLDDETYDKLMKNAKKGQNGQGGLMIRREHPKPEKDTKEGNQKDQGGTEGSKDGEKTEEKGGQSKGGGDTSPDSKPNAGEKTSGSDATNQGSGSSEADAVSGTGEGPQGEDTAKSVEKAMKEAAETIREEALQEIDNVNMTKAREEGLRSVEVEDVSRPVTQSDVREICTDFKELRREYILTEPLPEVLARRGRTMLRKNQQYFRSLSTPNATYLENGSVDPSRLAGLAMGDTDIFRRQGKDRKFDGCVYILMDNSVSMEGNKRTEAAKAAAVIEESFRGLIPIKIVAFDNHGSVIHEVIKGFDEQKQKNCTWNWCLKGRTGGDTPTAESVSIAAKEILARPERKKLIIVLTDGEPNNREATKQAIAQARRNHISVFGIYFEEGSIRRAARTFTEIFEDRDIVMCELSQVDEKLGELMQKFARSN